MKSKILKLLLFQLLYSSLVYSQERCGTYQLEQSMLQLNPRLRTIAFENEQRNKEWTQRQNFGKNIESNPTSGMERIKNITPSTQSLCGYNNSYFTTIAAPSILNQITSPTPNCTYGGEYVTVTNMIAGNIYQISTCALDIFDTQLTIYPEGGGQAVAHNDDWCGAQSVIFFNPIVSGNYDILINEYDCQTNSLCSSLDVTLFYTPRPILTIPVVVHVVYKNSTENISSAQIQSQIDVLNADFRRLNSDLTNTPAAFRGSSDDPLIEFCLAERDPNGNSTTGITRTFTSSAEFNTDNFVKFTSQGGEDAWNPLDYLNLWVCDIRDPILGYAQFPYMLATDIATDGVVIDYAYFGNIGTATPPFHLGRTATHEVGHWLNLRHIWGDEPNCAADDSLSDTPLQSNLTLGNSMFPLLDACSPNYPGIMFCNYMDYSDDAALTMFTTGQAGRMDASIFNERNALWSSLGCQAVITGETELNQSLVVTFYPNPSSGGVNFRSNREIKFVEVTDIMGKIIFSDKPNQTHFSISLNQAGIYFVTSISNQNRNVQKIVIN